jgi:cardiolipin synthase
VLGSYLDPLADKALFAPVAVAMAATQLLPPWLVLLAVGRDVALVAGAFVFRARAMNWRIPSLREFFRMVPLSSPDGSDAAGSHAAPRVQPLLVSKLNTVLQIGTATAALATSAWGMPGQEVVDAGVLACAGTTVVSGAMYLRMAMSGRYRA